MAKWNTVAADGTMIFNPLEHGIQNQPLMVPAHEYNKLQAELRIRRDAMSRQPFCPDHRDKVLGKPCRECEIERLRHYLIAIRDQSMTLTREEVEAMCQRALGEA